MRIVVCIKSVIVKPTGNRYIRTPETTSLNDFDRPAITMGLSLAASSNGTLTALTMGPPDAGYALYQAMALGADRGILISDPRLRESDTLVTAMVLSTALEKTGPWDLILFGTRSSDSDTGHVGPQTAQTLGLPFLINVTAIEKSPSGLSITRELDGFQEHYQSALPASFSVSAVPGETMPPTFSDIETAFESRHFETLNCDELGISAERLGLQGSPTRLIAMTPKRKRATCEFLQGPPDKQAEHLAEKLAASGLIG